MKYIKRFNEELLEPNLIDAINFLKTKKNPKKEVEETEDLNLKNMEINHFIEIISKNYTKPYPQIAKIMGIPIRTFMTKLDLYDLQDLKRQIKERKGKGWDHQYNKIKLESIQYNEELQKIKSKESISGRTKEFDIILDEPISNHSLSSNVLLKKRFRDIEDEETIKRLTNFNKMSSEERKLFYKNTRNITPLEITFNNLQFLKDTQKERGELRCEYCNKGPLKIYDFNPNEINISNIRNKKFRFQNTGFNSNNAATTDHKHPMSKGGDPFDYSNLAVCCNRCNSTKGNMDWKDWCFLLKNRKQKR